METLNLTQDLFTIKSDRVFNTYTGSDSIVAIANPEGNEVNALTGNDKIIGIAKSTDDNAEANENNVNGIRNEGTIDTDFGNDLVLGIASGNGAVGIFNNFGTIDGGAGNDLILGNASGDGVRGIFNFGTIDGGAGNDLIMGTGTDISTGLASASGLDFNLGRIKGGGGNDRIIGNAIATATDIFASANGIFQGSSTVNTGAGDDLISGTSTSTATGEDTRSFATGFWISDVSTGTGNDRIFGTAIATNNSNSAFVGADGIFLLESNNRLTAGAGDDSLTGIASVSIAAVAGDDFSRAKGIANAGTIDMGAGNDRITGTVYVSAAQWVGTAFGIENQGTINAGAGNDVLISSSTLNGVSQEVTVNGDGAIAMGSGNDYFKGFGSTTVFGDNGTGNQGFDILDLGLLAVEVFSSITKTGSIGNDNYVQFTFDDHSMITTEFEKFILDGVAYSYQDLPTV